MMAVTMMDNPFIAIIVVAVVVVAIIFKVLGNNKMGKFKEFKPRLFSESIYDDFKEKIKLQGVKMKKGRLVIGFNEVARIESYLLSKMSLPNVTYDPKTRQFKMKPKSEDKEAQFLIIRCKSKSFLKRLFGVGKIFFILNYDDKGKGVKVDPMERRIFLPMGTDLISYGNVWLNHDFAQEYINDISMKRQMEAQMTHVENMPDRVVHLETEQAKKERITRTLADIEKAKYERSKSADDTVVS